MSEYTYTRPALSTGVGIAVHAENSDGKTLPKLIEEALPGKAFKLELFNTTLKAVFDAALSSGDETTLAGVVNGFAADELSALKRSRYVEINARTQEFIFVGFYHKNVLFSLSREAQINLLGLKFGIDDGTITFPQPYSTKDDGVYMLADAAEGNDFFDAALAVKKNYLESGATMKAQIKAAANEAAVNAVVDDRVEEPYGPGGSSSG